MKLIGKKALIIGGNSGIGLATARFFIAEAEGAQVAITGRDQKTLDEAIAELGSSKQGPGKWKMMEDAVGFLGKDRT
jgi:NAD(P)-dependent dehydrogenase (short-subunit alcohol dehydrogenase family)